MPTVTDYTVTCAFCLRNLPHSESITTQWNDICCQACFNRRFFYCEDCGAIGYQGDSPGNHYCADCYDRLSRWHPVSVSHVTSTKKTATGRKFGIELETSSCPQHIMLRGKTCFGSKYDGSINGMEFVSPVLRGDRGLAEVRKFCRLAKRYNFQIDNTCGFHLHVDMTDLTETQRKSVAYAYRLTLTLWQHLVHRNRWSNQFCHRPDYAPEDILTARNFRDFEDWQSRYHFINLRAYHEHHTYEMRGYQGTLNAVEICNWVKVHLRFVEFVKDKTPDELRLLFGVNLRKSKKNMRKIFGVRLSNYYSKLWRENARRAEVANRGL
jgi:hypothetical protein